MNTHTHEREDCKTNLTPTGESDQDDLFVSGRLWIENDLKRETIAWAQQMRDDGLKKSVARDRFRTRHEDKANAMGLSTKAIDRIFNTVYRPPSPTSADAPTTGRMLSDLGNANRFVDQHHERVRYVPALGKWLMWDGTRWAYDDRNMGLTLARETVRSIYAEAASEPDGEKRDKVGAWALKSEAAPRVEAIVRLAKGDQRVVATTEDFDAKAMLLNCVNGTVDLTTGALREHRREDLLTRRTSVAYDPTAACPTWERFLEQVFAGDAEMVEFVKRAVGYSLTDSVGEQVMFFLYGFGANGKGTFLHNLRRLLGDYAKQAEPDLLMARRGESHPTGQADLMGSRFVVAVETRANRSFDEATLKRLTGGDRMKARFMGKDFFEFDPTHKIWLAANHKPNVRDTTHAMWRRIKVIEFAVTFQRHEWDLHLDEKLQAEGPGILRWAVEGCLDWQQVGLNPPMRVELSTEEYRRDEDHLAMFIEDVCVVGDDEVVTSAGLLQTYETWCESNGVKRVDRLSAKALGMAMKERGFRPGKPGGSRGWFGIGVRPMWPAGMEAR